MMQEGYEGEGPVELYRSNKPYLTTDQHSFAGAMALKDKCYKEAVQHFNEVLRSSAKRFSVYGQRGMAHQGLGQHEEAIADFTVSLEKYDPEKVAILEARGKSYQCLKDYENAAKDFTQAFKLAPNNTDLFRRMIECQFKIEDYQSVVDNMTAYLGKQVRKKPNDLYRLVQAQFFLGQYEKAQETLESILQIDSGNAFILSCSGEIKEKLEQYEAALQDFDRALEIDPNNKETIYSRLKIKESLGQHEEVLEELNAQLKLDPNETRFLAMKIDIEIRLGDYDAALEGINKMLTLDPGQILSHFMIGDILRKAERFELALPHLNQFLTLEPNHQCALFARGEVHFRLKDYEEAKKNFKQLQLEPPDSLLVLDRLNYIELRSQPDLRAASEKMLANPQQYGPDETCRMMINLITAFNDIPNEDDYLVLKEISQRMAKMPHVKRDAIDIQRLLNIACYGYVHGFPRPDELCEIILTCLPRHKEAAFWRTIMTESQSAAVEQQLFWKTAASMQCAGKEKAMTFLSENIKNKEAFQGLLDWIKTHKWKKEEILHIPEMLQILCEFQKRQFPHVERMSRQFATASFNYLEQDRFFPKATTSQDEYHVLMSFVNYLLFVDGYKSKTSRAVAQQCMLVHLANLNIELPASSMNRARFFSDYECGERERLTRVMRF